MIRNIAIAAFAALSLNLAAKETPISDTLRKLCADPVLNEKIALGIENNRKGDFYLNFVNEKRKPVQVENLKVEMIKHDFLFGAHVFSLNCFKDEEEIKYEQNFKKVFNFATLPFYWKGCEITDGHYNFEERNYVCFEKNKSINTESWTRHTLGEKIKFCQDNDIKMKGHPLSWYYNKYSLPDWVEREEKVIERKMCRYIDKIAKDYGDTINTWDVSNEAADTQDGGNGNYNYFPRDHAFKAFKEAERVMPYSNDFIANFTTPVWFRTEKYSEYGTDYLLLSDLINRGCKVDIIGLQLHFFKGPDRDMLYKGRQWYPDYMFKVLDTFAKFNKPIHITELSFPCMDEDTVGEEKQAFILENFYKLWFSHPKVEAITYWHFVDGRCGCENFYNAGLLRADFSKKPAFEILDKLVNKVWRTNLSFANPTNEVHFRCFYGKYKIMFTANGKQYERTITLNKNVRKRAYIEIEK